ncbi:dATP pyrophosphohydrolase [Variovorax boronicumulans]|uniref:dATP pyrophosphohydrolase n=1 Tax=Variovorax boronicumulans TaxID=436515 RepID=A0AAW8CV18_9BURK|nr:dihydroneopterin triphosphate diphosphatase [Variovorax boronicumulans]MDP9894279.1 dATP pyrophosphohydrolase [Variovorax boronicumulans]MDP9990226.1 dATP pyrophosphohydrolase [Variovorax boronicumulans]MDQ0001266.1 dATP pyrophosphohydrolase [Variovorax boronicumulans]MDQ0054098.1 dATP pyrophosphohydrolase [Variovorax boronicumulans]
MGSDTRPFKIPESVLVVIHTPALDVLLIRRADANEFWQSVTGSKDAVDEPLALTAAREVAEETGIECGKGTALASQLVDWQLSNIYEIYPGWRARYEPGVTHNTEHLFGLCVPERLTPRLAPREHTDWQWLPYREAADACFSPSNAEAILLLPEFAR